MIVNVLIGVPLAAEEDEAGVLAVDDDDDDELLPQAARTTAATKIAATAATDRMEPGRRGANRALLPMRTNEGATRLRMSIPFSLLGVFQAPPRVAGPE